MKEDTSETSLKKRGSKSFTFTGTTFSTDTYATATTTGSKSWTGKPSTTTTSGGFGSFKHSRTLVKLVNPVTQPLPIDPSGKCRGLLVVGCGDSGQFGMGVERLREYNKPKLDEIAWAKIVERQWGPSGVERVAAGGMHSLVLDSNGKVLVESCFDI